MTLLQATQLELGHNNTFQADGGNVVILSGASTITGGANNKFIARAVGTSSASATGGGIELGAGTTASRLNAAFFVKPGTVPFGSPQVLGSNVVINNNANTTGAIQTNILNGGHVDLSHTTGNLATLNLNGTGGVVVFDANGSKSVELEGATFTVDAFRPISYSSVSSSGASPASTMNQADTAAAEDVLSIANVFTPGKNGRTLLAARKNQTRRGVEADLSDMVTLKIKNGEVFVNPLRSITIDCQFGKLFVKKGAMVLLAKDAATAADVRITVCSGPGDATLVVGNRSVNLHPGEEIVVSSSERNAQQMLRADGIGRRNFHSYKCGEHFINFCDSSIASMLTNKQYLSCLKHPQTELEKRLATKLMKTAAALTVVGAGKGPYQAQFSQKPESKGVYKPVGYASSLP